MNSAQTEVLVYFRLLAEDFSIEDVTNRHRGHSVRAISLHLM